MNMKRNKQVGQIDYFLFRLKSFNSNYDYLLAYYINFVLSNMDM